MAEPSPHVDEWGHAVGYCNSCGDEASFEDGCCDDGEVVPYDDDPEED